MPRFLLIYPEGGDRVVVDAWKQVGRVLAEHPGPAHVVDLRYYCEIAQQELALVEMGKSGGPRWRRRRRAVKAGQIDRKRKWQKYERPRPRDLRSIRREGGDHHRRRRGEYMRAFPPRMPR